MYMLLLLLRINLEIKVWCDSGYHGNSCQLSQPTTPAPTQKITTHVDSTPTTVSNIKQSTIPAANHPSPITTTQTRTTSTCTQADDGIVFEIIL